jgi:hypothetical protein
LYSVVLDSKAKTAKASNPDAMPMGSAMGEIYSMLIVGQENLDEKIMREVKGQVVFTVKSHMEAHSVLAARSARALVVRGR